MKKLLILCFVLTGAYVLAQTCVVPAPTTPPIANTLVITLPAGGGTVGCTAHAVLTVGGAHPTEYPIGNAKCAQAVAIATQAIANDNGWNDGGVP